MRKIILTVICSGLCLALLVAGFIKLGEYNIKKDVKDHLLKQGYRESDIISITTHFGKLPSFSAGVIFTDEPNITYYYLKDEKGVSQYTNQTREKRLQYKRIKTLRK